MELIDVNLNKQSDMHCLKQFYDEVYVYEFTDENEIETYENIIKSIENISDECDYHVLLLKLKNRVIGGVIFDYFPKIKSAVVEFLAISKKYQGKKYGTLLFEKSLKLIKKNGQELDYIFADINKYDESIKSMNYLYFWKSLNFKIINFDYLQPALGKGKKEVNYLNLIFNSYENKSLKKEVLTNFLLHYAKYSMRIINPEKNLTIIKLLQNVEKIKDIKLSKII